MTDIRGVVSRILSRLAFALLLILIVWMPLPWGSNRPWSALLITALVGIALLVWALSALLDGSGRDWPLSGLVPGTALFAAWLGYLTLQTIALPAGWVDWLSPETGAIHTRAALAGIGAPSALSLDIGTTRAETLRYASYLSLFVLVTFLVDNAARLATLLGALFAAGLTESVAGIMFWAAGTAVVPVELTDGHWMRVIGTFVNRNHFAAHVAMAIAAGVGLLIALQPPDGPRGNWRTMLSSALGLLLSPRLILVLGLVVMISALLLSGSAGGAGSLFAAMAVTAAAGRVLHGSDATSSRVTRTVIVIALLGVVVSGGGVLLQRVLGDGFQSTLAGRFDQWQLTLAMIRDFPWFGVGAGNYQWVFPVYRDETLSNLLYDYAHNDYLQLLSDQGIVGLLMLGGAVTLVMTGILRGYARRRHPLARGALFASLCGTGVMLIHGLADFNFHIPANAAYFFVLLGTGVVAANIDLQHERRWS